MMHLRFLSCRLLALLLLPLALLSCQRDPMEGGFNFSFSFSLCCGMNGDVSIVNKMS